MNNDSRKFQNVLGLNKIISFDLTEWGSHRRRCVISPILLLSVYAVAKYVMIISFGEFDLSYNYILAQEKLDIVQCCSHDSHNCVDVTD